MSGQEEDVSLVRLMRQRVEVRKSLALLANQLESAGRHLEELGGALKFGFRNPSGDRGNIASLLSKAVPEFLDLPKLRARMDEYRRLEEDLAQLNARAREAGID